jgi:hypothetical protein
MRAPDRDRCRPAIAALCLALLLISAPVLALSAEYRVYPNGTAYQGSVRVEHAKQFEFTEVGMLGEKIPIPVTGVSLSGDCLPCNFTWRDPTAITFPEGNYTVRYSGPINQNHLVFTFPEPYSVSVVLPHGLDVRNRLLGMINPTDAVVSEETDGSLAVKWNSTRSAELRFYSPDRELLLNWFGQFWIIIAIVMLLPFFFSRRRG